jgi:hypothetical protein
VLGRDAAAWLSTLGAPTHTALTRRSRGAVTLRASGRPLAKVSCRPTYLFQWMLNAPPPSKHGRSDLWAERGRAAVSGSCATGEAFLQLASVDLSDDG